MDDYQAMRAHLEALSEDEFCRLRWRFGSEVKLADKKTFEVDPESGDSRPLEADWRRQLIEEMLEWKEDHKALWNRLCSVTGIDSDASRNMRVARCALLLSAIAIVVSIISLLR